MPRWRLTTDPSEGPGGVRLAIARKVESIRNPSPLSAFTLWRACIVWGPKVRLTHMQAINANWLDFLLVMGNHAALLLRMVRVQCPRYGWID